MDGLDVMDGLLVSPLAKDVVCDFASNIRADGGGIVGLALLLLVGEVVVLVPVPPLMLSVVAPASLASMASPSSLPQFDAALPVLHPVGGGSWLRERKAAS